VKSTNYEAPHLVSWVHVYHSCWLRIFFWDKAFVSIIQFLGFQKLDIIMMVACTVSI